MGQYSTELSHYNCTICTIIVQLQSAQQGVPVPTYAYLYIAYHWYSTAINSVRRHGNSQSVVTIKNTPDNDSQNKHRRPAGVISTNKHYDIEKQQTMQDRQTDVRREQILNNTLQSSHIYMTVGSSSSHNRSKKWDYQTPGQLVFNSLT